MGLMSNHATSIAHFCEKSNKTGREFATVVSLMDIVKAGKYQLCPFLGITLTNFVSIFGVHDDVKTTAMAPAVVLFQFKSAHGMSPMLSAIL
jgi:hypothetical protein